MENKEIDLRIPRTGILELTKGNQKIAYEIDGHIFGGSSICYFAHRGERHYVIKELYPPKIAFRNFTNGLVMPYSNQDCRQLFQEYKKRFQRESRLNTKAFYKNFHTVSYCEEFFENENCILQTPVQGSLHDLNHALIFLRGKQPMERLKIAISITRSLLCALAVLHTGEEAVVHFDLSLSNVFYSEEHPIYNAFLLDFGNARELVNGEVRVSGELDTPSTSMEFGAPELSYASVLTSRADLYSVGVIFFHLLTSGTGIYKERLIPSAEQLSCCSGKEMKHGLDALDMPAGVKHVLRDFLLTACCSAPEYRFRCAEDMINALDLVMEIAESNGIHREVLLLYSGLEFQKMGYEQLREELFPQMDLSIPKHTLLLGDGGSGKTCYLYRLWNAYLKAADRDISKPIPLYVDVKEFDKDREHKDTFILRNIIEHYAPRWDKGDLKDVENQTADAAVQRLRELLGGDGAYLILVDGLDEAKDASGLDQQFRMLLDNPNLWVCVASRKKPDINQSIWNRLTELFMPKLTEETINNQLIMNGFSPVTGRLLRTLHRPMFLAVYLGLKPGTAVQTPGEILKAHHDRLISRYEEAGHQECSDISRRVALSEALPYLAAHTNAMYFTKIKNEPDIFDNRYPGETDRLLDIFVNCGFLQKHKQNPITQDQPYTWTHQMYKDFNKAAWIKMEMEFSPNKLETTLSKEQVENSVLSLLGDILGEYRFTEKNDVSSEMSPIEGWMQKYLRGKRSETAQMTVHNLIECMKISRHNQVTSHHQVTSHYDELDLQLVQFYDCCLPNSTFEGCAIRRDLFILPGHLDSVEGLAYARKKGVLASFSKTEMHIFLWKSELGMLINRINCNAFVRSIDISPNEEFLLAELYSEDVLSIDVFRIDTGKRVSSIPLMRELTDINYGDQHITFTGLAIAAFLCDSQTILLAAHNGIAVLVDALTGKVNTQPHQLEDPIQGDSVPLALAIVRYYLSQDRRKVVSFFLGDHATIWNATTLSLVETVKYDKLGLFGIIDSLALTADGLCMVTSPGSGQPLISYNLRSRKTTTSFTTPPVYDSIQLIGVESGIIGCTTRLNDDFVYDHCCFIWEISSGQFSAVDARVYENAVVLSQDGTTLLVHRPDGCVDFYCLPAFRKTHTFRIGPDRYGENTLVNIDGICAGNEVFRVTRSGAYELLNIHSLHLMRLEFRDVIHQTQDMYWFVGENYVCCSSPSQGIHIVWILLNDTIVKRCCFYQLKGQIVEIDILRREIIFDLGSEVKVLSLEDTNRELSMLDGEKLWIEHLKFRLNSQREQISINGSKYVDITFNADTIIKFAENNYKSKLLEGYGDNKGTDCIYPKRNDTHCVIPDLKIIAGGGFDGTLRVWEIKSSKCVFCKKITVSPIIRISNVVNTTYAILETQAGRYILWDFDIMKQIASWKDRSRFGERDQWLEVYANCPTRVLPFIRQCDNEQKLTVIEAAIINFCGKKSDSICIAGNKSRIAIKAEIPDTRKILTISETGDSKWIELNSRLGFVRSFDLGYSGQNIYVLGYSGQVTIYNVNTGRQEFVWETIDAKDILNCNLKNTVYEEQEIKELLKMNGAIVDLQTSRKK